MGIFPKIQTEDRLFPPGDEISAQFLQLGRVTPCAGLCQMEIFLPDISLTNLLRSSDNFLRRFWHNRVNVEITNLEP